MTAGYDTILRTQMVIHVREKQLRVVCKDGRVLNFSHEPQELRDFILCQISQHQVFWEIPLRLLIQWGLENRTPQTEHLKPNTIPIPNVLEFCIEMVHHPTEDLDQYPP